MVGKQREVPWCAVALVVLALISHTMVLMGNLDTANSFAAIGKATGGWSDVGLGVSHSMVHELEHLLGEVNAMLTSSLSEVIEMEQMMDFVLGASGNTTQMAVKMLATGDVKAVQAEFPHNTLVVSDIEIVPLTVAAGNSSITNTANLNSQVPAIKGLVKGEVKQLVAKLAKKIESFWKEIRPALVQVGKWLHSMGEKMQGFIEQFSQTIDKAQKIFDQVMSKLAKKANTDDELLYHTFAIFDVHHKGKISADDVEEVSSLFGVTALSGDKGKELHDKYDQDKDGELDKHEYALFVQDKSIPGAMPYVLRTFSKRLSQITGQMKGAKKRDEVAETIVDYFQLMVAKNRTKTKWVSNALTNGSLPVEFSADVFYQLVLQDRSPDKLTQLPVGQTIIGYMVQLDADYVHKVVKEVADPVFWHKQGFDKKLQAPTVKTLKAWVNHAHTAAKKAETKSGNNTDDGKKSLLQDSSEEQLKRFESLIAELDGLTDEVLEDRMRRHQQKLREERIQVHEQVFYSDATKVLFRHLLGNVGLKGHVEDADIDRVTKGGVPAKPETLRFADFLVNNATHTSEMFQKYAFDNAKTSSNPIDSFANQIQAFIKKVSQFLDLLMSMTTERGIHSLHTMVDNFIHEAANDVDKVVNNLIDQMLLSDGTVIEAGQISALQLSSKDDVQLSGVFTAIDDLFGTLKSVLPTVIEDIKFAKKEVSSVASTLKSIFSTFKEKGDPIFENVANLYASMWTTYYILFFVLSLLLLFYAFWAYGWFTSDDGSPSQNGCIRCLQDTQDSCMCFWTCILISEVVILIMFVVSIVFCVIAGVKAFVAFGCDQIYVLNDDAICTDILTGIRDWMETFWTDMPSKINDACEERTLTACKVIAADVMSSAMKTVGGSFLAAVFSFQLLFLSAKLHEKVRYIDAFVDMEEKSSTS